MSTYETMKHNIPEGATHYQEEGNGYLFAWFKEDGDSLKIFVPEAPLSSWTNCFKSAYEDLIKPIPTKPTYRYEKVEDTGFFELKDEFQGRMIFFNQSRGMDIIELSHHFMQKNLYRRIEVKERELFIEEACKRCNYDPNSAAGSLIGDMYDAGCRFVNGKG